MCLNSFSLQRGGGDGLGGTFVCALMTGGPSNKKSQTRNTEEILRRHSYQRTHLSFESNLAP